MAVNMAAAPTSWTTFYLKVHVPLIQLSFLTYFLFLLSIKINACTWFRRVFIVLPLLNVQYQNRNWIQIQLEKSQSLSFQEHN